MKHGTKGLLFILCLFLVPCIVFLTVTPPDVGSEEPTAVEETTAPTGFVYENGKLYYYGEDGQIQKGGIVGAATPDYRFADSNGVCCTSEEIQLAANFIREYGEGETPEDLLASCFTALANDYEYERDYHAPSVAEDLPHEAIVMFTEHKGNCYKYAVCFACVARVLGYPARVVLGGLPQDDGEIAPHAWTEVYIDDYWYVCDANAQMQEYWNTLAYYKMYSHCWVTQEYDVFEVSINDDGKAVWESVMYPEYDAEGYSDEYIEYDPEYYQEAEY